MTMPRSDRASRTPENGDMDLPEPSVMELFDLSGRAALVTGGSGHLGGAIARGLAEAGARVAVSSRDLARAERAADALPPVPAGGHVGVALDHEDEESLAAAVNVAVERMGRLDVLVNNAHQPLGKDWRDVTPQEFTRQLANATSYFSLARRFRDHVVGREGHGSLILVGSMYGSVGSYPDAYEGIGPASPVAYQVLKGGIAQMARHLAVYWARDGVRVNCLSPGPFPADGAPPQLVARLSTRSPMGRIGTPVEIKGAAVFLASAAGSYVTGQNLLVDGGWTAW